MHIELYDEKNIEQIHWPETEEGKQACNFLYPLIKNGVKNYIANTDTKLYLLVINDHVLPVTVNDHEYDSSYLTSNYFAINFLKAWLQEKLPLLTFLHQPLIQGLGFCLKRLKINKTVIVNNWLLTTNIYPKLSKDEIQAATHFLSQRFPDHLLVMRSLDSYNCGSLIKSCKDNRFRLLCMRFVHIYDPLKKGEMTAKNKYHHRRDMRLIDKFAGQIIQNQDVKYEEFPRLLELFQSIYFKHTTFSPEYTVKFLQLVVEKKFFNLFCIKDDDQIQGVFGYYFRNGIMAVPFIGFSRPDDMPMQYYRILTMLAIRESDNKKLVLNEGSGGATHKQARGMKPFPEYTAIYDRHLPFSRRILWGCAEKIIQWIIFPMIHRKNRHQ